MVGSTPPEGSRARSLHGWSMLIRSTSLELASSDHEGRSGQPRRGPLAVTLRMTSMLNWAHSMVIESGRVRASIQSD